MTPLLIAPFLLLPARDTDFGQTWETIEKAIRGRYYAREQREDEMDRLLRKYEPLAKKAKSKMEFASTVNDMIGEFKDSHFALLTTDDQGYYVMDALARREPVSMPNFGAWFKSAPEGYTITMVLNGGEAEKAGLRKGDVVVQVDGTAFSPIASLKSRVGKKAELTVKRSGKEIKATVEVESDAATTAFLDASRASAKIIDYKGKKIGYFHLWMQINDRFRDALAGAVYGKLKDTDAFILDLRDGFGGRPEGFADPFFRPEVKLDWMTTPSQGMHQLFGYQRPLVVIINEGSRSAKEVLSYILKKSKRATLVGSTTAGHVLGTFPQRISDWAYLEIPMVDVLADGFRIEGKGVAPDVKVTNEFDENGKDLYLEAALARLVK